MRKSDRHGKKEWRIWRILAMLALFVILSGCGKDAVTDVKPEGTGTEKNVDEQGQTQEEKEDAAEAQADYILTVESVSSWSNGEKICTQFDAAISNHTEKTGKDWKVSITVPEGAEIESSWNGNYSINGTTLEITPVDYNVEVPAGGEVTFGFILDTLEAFSLDEGILSIGDKEYALGGQVRDSAANSSRESDTEQEELTEAEVAAPDTTGTPVANHGALSIKGTDIVDKNGKLFQLKGVSTHGINWFPEYVNKQAFSSLAGYGVNAIRLAMYTADNSGYCSGGSPDELEKLVNEGVTACTELGLYVIIDWHILNDGDPNQYKEEAKDFFDKMAGKYANYDNVIYEICNEPNGGTTWESVKAYAEEIIPVIRKKDKEALIIVGTPNWSQDVDIASDNPIANQDNLLYAVHFYASTHKSDMRRKVETARGKGLPVIVSECSICEASGNGTINYDEAESWMELIDKYHLGFFAWNLSNKDEQSSLLKSSVAKTGDFSKEDFSETGLWFMDQFGK
ncbi:MAG: cellulase family glycosylhydrolase [Lachnospiraceae bacterium]|nr:cellulase family glycosylhydrolase [Lachnospiraceae bacterium]